MLGLVENPKDKFSGIEVHIISHARIQRGGPGVRTPLEFENFT